MAHMTKDQIIALAERIASLPEEAQAQIEQTVAEAEARYEPAYRLTPEQVAEVREIREGLRNGTERFATDEEMQAVWSEFGL